MSCSHGNSAWKLKLPCYFALTLRQRIELKKKMNIIITGCGSHIQEQDWKTSTQDTDLHFLESHVDIFIFLWRTVKKIWEDEIEAPYLGVNVHWQQVLERLQKFSVDWIQKILKIATFSNKRKEFSFFCILLHPTNLIVQWSTLFPPFLSFAYAKRSITCL